MRPPVSARAWSARAFGLQAGAAAKRRLDHTVAWRRTNCDWNRATRHCVVCALYCLAYCMAWHGVAWR
eukprot:5696275-Lingulodinium_polyedra.AAC.1